MVELVWDGKYDSNGKRVAPLRLKLPFQTVETVNESVQQRQMALDLFSLGKQSDWRNRLIWGDKKYVLPALLDEFAGKEELIYIDPTLKGGADFLQSNGVWPIECSANGRNRPDSEPVMRITRLSDD